jgi:hypothetical protein
MAIFGGEMRNILRYLSSSGSFVPAYAFSVIHADTGAAIGRQLSPPMVPMVQVPLLQVNDTMLSLFVGLPAQSCQP